MNAVKYFMLENKINMARQVIWIIVLINGWIMSKTDLMLMQIIFMTLMAMILQGTNFLYIQKCTVGFINMLPCTDKDRVMGRYMSGGVYLAIASIMQFVFLLICSLTEKSNVNLSVNSIIIGFSCGLILMAIYSNLFYLAEQGNVNLKSVLFILPLFFMGSTMQIAISYETDESGSRINALTDFVNENIITVTIVALVVGILFYWFSMKVAVKIVKNKDYV